MPSPRERVQMNDDGDPRTDDVCEPAMFVATETSEDDVYAVTIEVGMPPCSVCDNACAEGYENTSTPLCQACHDDYVEFDRLSSN